MGEATRDAYVLACMELDAATKAFEAAGARVRCAREACEKLEAALNMTCLSDTPLPQLDCAEARRALALALQDGDLPPDGPARRADDPC